MLLADEPTGNLDSRSGEAVLTLLEDLNRERGVALAIVTHDASVAARARRQITMRDGLIVTATGPAGASRRDGSNGLTDGQPARRAGPGRPHEPRPRRGGSRSTRCGPTGCAAR